MLYSIVNSPIVSYRELNEDLKVMERWTYQWELEFYPDPTNQTCELTFLVERKSPFFNGNPVSKTLDLM